MSDIFTKDAFEEAADMDLAKNVAEILVKAYPGWLWAVEIPQHNIVIRLLDAPIVGMGWFINRKHLGTPDTLKRIVQMGAGEFLERCGCPRGKKPEGFGIGRVEGVDLKNYVDPVAKAIARSKGDR